MLRMSEPTTHRRVFITGAMGLIGRQLAERFLADGWQVAGVDLNAAPASGIVAGDVSQAGEWQDSLAGANLVIHAAAKVGLGTETQEYWKINCIGTKHVLDAAAQFGVSRFVQISSIAAFGFDYPDGADESYPLCPNGVPYVDTKIAGEHAVLQAHAAGKIACTIIRPGEVYGPESVFWTINPMREIAAGRFMLPARGRGILTPVYIDDLVEGIFLASEHPAAAGQIFTITSGEVVTTKEFYQHYSRILNARKIPTLPTNLVLFLLATIGRLMTPLRDVSSHDIRFLARRGGYSIEKARNILRFRPAVSLEEGMSRIEKWVRETNPLNSRSTSPPPSTIAAETAK